MLLICRRLCDKCCVPRPRHLRVKVSGAAALTLGDFETAAPLVRASSLTWWTPLTEEHDTGAASHLTYHDVFESKDCFGTFVCEQRRSLGRQPVSTLLLHP